MTEQLVKASIPRVFAELLQPAPYKAYYGGRGGGKSHSFSIALIILGTLNPLRILCCREIQNSIKDSVKRVLDDIIDRLDLRWFYTSTDTEIRGKNGTLFIFRGLRSNAYSLKSIEGLDIAWVEEANTVSTSSWDLLIPTVRKERSEIWASWNPRFAKDPVDKMFRGEAGPPPGSIVRKVGWGDNDWFPENLRMKMEFDRSRDPDKYAHVWVGEYLRNSEARVFRNWRIEPVVTPADARFFFGADWGFDPDPSALIRCFIKGRTLYVDGEAYMVGCELDYLPALFGGTDARKLPDDTPIEPRWANPKGYPGVPGALKWKIRADSARPDTIQHVRKRGFDIVPARKGPGSVEDSIEFLKNFDIVVDPSCKNMIDELSLFSHKTDKLTDEVLPELEDKHNHCIDALRYAVEEQRRSPGSFAVPIVVTRPRNWPG